MSDHASEVPTLELRRYAVILRRRAHWVVAFLLVGLAAAGGYLAAAPTTATAATLVNVNVIALEPFSNTREPSGLIDAQTEVQTARSSTVVSNTAEALGGGLTASEVREALQVELYPDGTVLRISYTAGTVKDAILGADEAARQFLEYRGELAALKLTTITDQLTTRRDLLRDELLQVNRDLNRKGPRGVQAESDRQLLNLELDSLLGQINQINAVDTTGGTILTAANDIGAVIRPQQGLILAGGGLVGLLLGLVAAFVRDAADRRVRDSRDIERSGAGPLLARLKLRRASIPARGSDLDAVRSLWEGLLVTLPDEGPVVVVADVTEGATPSDVAANMALAMTETGRTVELVLPEQSAESDALLSGRLPLVDVVDDGWTARAGVVDAPRLSLVFVGRPGVEARSVAATLVEVLESAKQSADVTVVATSTAHSRSTRMAASRLGDETLLVVAERQTKRRTLAEVVDDLDEVRAQIAGHVVVHRGRHLEDRFPGAATTTDEQAPVSGARGGGAEGRPGRTAPAGLNGRAAPVQPQAGEAAPSGRKR